MFEAMYLKQKANNSFFTGDTHVLDLTSRNVVARSIENATQEREQEIRSERVVAEAPTSSTEVRLTLGTVVKLGTSYPWLH